MADMYKRKSFGSGIGFILLIPIGFIAIVYIFDFCQKIYYQQKLNSVVREVLELTLDRDGLDSDEKMKEFAIKKFTDKGYATDDMSFINMGDYYILVNYTSYTSVVGSLSFGLLRTKNQLVHSSYKGYYNEYHETQIEKVNEEDDEDLLYDEDEEIIIQ